MIQLRDYQQAAHDSVYSYWRAEEKGNPLIVAPCGAGKSLIIGALITGVMEYPGTRVLVLAHRQELLTQNEAELRKFWPDAPTGFFSSGIGEKDYNAPVTFAGIQTIEKRITDFEPFDLCIIDEAHMLPRSARTRYGKVVEALKLMRPTCRFIGLTATPYRLDSGSLVDGDGALFDKVTYDIPVQKLVDDGYLCEVVARGGEQQADMSGVKRRGGEFVAKDMAAQFSDQLIESACDQIIREGQNRRAWLIYCASVSSAEVARDYMLAQGIEAELVTGSMAKGERNDAIKRFKAGQLKCIINVDVLTIGFNAPICDLCALLRATDSAALYVQIVGRIMRTYDGKDDALLLDFGGNVVRHGPIDDINVHTPGDGDGDAPAKECPECALLLPAGVRYCPECGHEFPPPQPKLEKKAYRGAVMKRQKAEPIRLGVLLCTATEHRKPGKPPSVQVTYTTADGAVKEWLCPEHGGYATQVAAKAVSARYGVRCPSTADELIKLIRGHDKPSAVTVKREGKYSRVTAVHFEKETA